MTNTVLHRQLVSARNDGTTYLERLSPSVTALRGAPLGLAGRRGFLKTAGALAAVPVVAAACGREENGGGRTPGDTLGMFGDADVGAPGDADACGLTNADILGPYYLAGSPERRQIAEVGEPGVRLNLTGRVFARDCVTPIVGALVEVWQANDAGVYDSSAAFRLRGGQRSAADGFYAFDTIRPGFYAGRPRHIHYRVAYERAPGVQVVFITQLYFAPSR
jgi:hypothetical protein